MKKKAGFDDNKIKLINGGVNMEPIGISFIIGGSAFLTNIAILYFFKKHYDNKLQEAIKENKKLLNITYTYVANQDQLLTNLRKELKILLTNIKDLQIKVDTLFRLAKQTKIQHTDMQTQQANLEIKIKEIEDTIEKLIKTNKIDSKIKHEIIKMQAQLIKQNQKLDKLDNIMINTIQDYSMYKMN